MGDGLVEFSHFPVSMLSNFTLDNQYELILPLVGYYWVESGRWMVDC